MAKIGKLTIQLLISSEEEEKELLKKITQLGYKYAIGKSGTMDSKAVIAAIETTAKREGIIINSSTYREEHALYHTAINALRGLCRGEIGIGSLLRTVGVKFVILRGPLDTDSAEKDAGEWLSVGIYGMIGAPIKGFEHEAIGLEINDI